jgi:hypothetical protein
MTMSSASVYRDPEEKAAVAKWFEREGLTVPGLVEANVIPIAERRRKPLGLGFVESPDDDPPKDHLLDTHGVQVARDVIAKAVARMPAKERARTATIEDTFSILEVPLAIAFDDCDGLFAQIKKLKADAADLKAAHREEVAELKLALVEMKCALGEMRAIQEHARASSRGEAGPVGPRGIPGPPGPRGERGKQGERGAPAREIAAYEPRIEQFQLVPIHTTGERGVPLSLRPFFDAYNAATESSEEG